MSSPALAQRFEEHRSHLLAVGYRLTGSIAEAEDAVQESWLRLVGADAGSVRDLRAWLTTVVGRICLDRLRSAEKRRESYVGEWLPEPVVTPMSANEPDPLEALVRDEEARLAAMIVLENLNPPQRVAFVLHDGYGVPFDEIADVLDLTVPAARQLASRARRVVAKAPRPVAAAEHDEAVGRVLAAFASADIDAVIAALHPEVVAVGDAGGTTRTALRPVVGADKVARFFFGLAKRYGFDKLEDYRPVLVNGRLGLYLASDAEHDASAARVLGFVVADGRVVGAYDFANPEKLHIKQVGP